MYIISYRTFQGTVAT